MTHHVVVQAAADDPTNEVVGNETKATVLKNSDYLTYLVDVSRNDEDGNENFGFARLELLTVGNGSVPVLQLNGSPLSAFNFKNDVNVTDVVVNGVVLVELPGNTSDVGRGDAWL